MRARLKFAEFSVENTTRKEQISVVFYCKIVVNWLFVCYHRSIELKVHRIISDCFVIEEVTGQIHLFISVP